MTPRRVLVVVPAHQEVARLGPCLEALATATATARRERPAVDVRTVVVLDRCTDGSALVAARHDVDVLAVDAGSVGAARRAGVAHARALAAPLPGGATCWVANTDADSRVEPTWLLDQLAHAAAGADLVLGRVALDPGEAHPGLLAAWLHRHPEPDRHVFGANLGVRLSTYDAVGGFAADHEHEDVRLAAAVVSRGGRVARSASVVTTSARRTGRTPGGLAGYLTTLESGLAPAREPVAPAAPVALPLGGTASA